MKAALAATIVSLDFMALSLAIRLGRNKSSEPPVEARSPARNLGGLARLPAVSMIRPASAVSQRVVPPVFPARGMRWSR